MNHLFLRVMKYKSILICLLLCAFYKVEAEEQVSFSIAVVGDLQVNGLQEVNYANQTILPELMKLTGIDFFLFMGDQVNDKPELSPLIKDIASYLSFPSYFLFGNHDRDLGPTGIQDSVFRAHFGPSFYYFNHKKVHFFILNNVSPKGKKGYEARYPEEQISFVKDKLRSIRKDDLIVLCQHIPMIYTQNKEELIELVSGRKNVLALSAHTHQIARHFIPNGDYAIHELVVGASCGSWWTGEKDCRGIPDALMQCGSPRNYFLIDFTDSLYRINYKGIGLDNQRQMDIWVSGQDEADTLFLPEGEFGNKVIASIYGASDSSIVTIRIDDLPEETMAKESIPAPAVRRIVAANKSEVYPTKYSRRSPLRQRNSPHVWSASLPDTLAKGMHTLYIRAKDRFGFDVTDCRMFFLE